MSVRAENLRWRAGGKLIVDEVSLSVETGQVLGLLGPNGSGKSSLLRLLAGLRRPEGGRILLDDTDIARLPRRALARQVALVRQHSATDTNMSVREIVRLGRTPHRAALSGWSVADERAVETALAQTGMAARAGQGWQSLSGGERQRTHIARALAQQPTTMFLDEPTNHLDIHHQIELLGLVRRLGLTSIIALHDLNHAAMFCDRVLVLQDGHAVASGTPANVLTESLLAHVFKVACRVTTVPGQDWPHIVFLPPDMARDRAPGQVRTAG
ncbi:ABC transporter ATP-binding protein [Roseicitreum antarcticum]|uniref:Iron complex transport system ATP-binding protein n=1 Tax=Roseicitreum antarcticum TaxID=564137 RepID=A0A1H2TSA9_9RHOB|nr:ABC transporter ATP-binding protein [Roseicitreum antarcticum]SDW46149.1 iron complex transport system ATP-binding protein [Roseicitreum antarcticum]